MVEPSPVLAHWERSYLPCITQNQLSGVFMEPLELRAQLVPILRNEGCSTDNTSSPT